MSDGEYKLVRLGDKGDWLQQSTENQDLLACPACSTGSTVIPLQLQTGERPSDPAVLPDQYRTLRCPRCDERFSTHPRTSYYREVSTPESRGDYSENS